MKALKIPLTKKEKEGETTAVVNTTAAVNPSGGCFDGFVKPNGQPTLKPP
jgi:hypothetical protein